LGYIQTRPPISEKAVLELADRIQQESTPFLDGYILSSIVKVAFYCGLKKSEIIKLKVGDIVDRTGNACDYLRCGDINIPLNNDAREMFRNHLLYMKKIGYSRRHKSPLFPKRTGKPYGPRQLQYDLKGFFKGHPDKPSLDKIRQSGICRYYDRLREEGKWAGECMRKTINFARCSPRQAHCILNKEIIPSGQSRYF